MTSDNRVSRINEDKVKALVRNLMFCLSFNTHLAGYEYLKEALAEYCLSSSNHKTLSRDVYPKLIQNYNTTRESIDRDIRTAIRRCHDDGELLKLNDIFCCRIVDDKYPPTNLEFIANVGSRLKYVLERDLADTLFECLRVVKSPSAM